MVEKVAIIGVGRLGSALALKLKSAGFAITFILDNDVEKATKIAFTTDSKVLVASWERLQEVDILFLTVPDDEIASLAKDLARLSFDWKDKTVIHCSGVTTVEVLSCLKDKGAKTLSLHPLQTFPESPQPERFYEIYCSVEGEDYELGARLVKALRAIPFKIASEQKALYHAGACLASNYVYSLLSAAEMTMVRAGIEQDTAHQALLPLVSGTVQSYEQLPVPQGLTGPLARGDIATVRKHLQALRKFKFIREVYQKLGIWTLSLSELPQSIKNNIYRYLYGK
jgi:predicted short-subunit dehydrogenase-like oxidoreductase (DUF2520 family)